MPTNALVQDEVPSSWTATSRSVIGSFGVYLETVGAAAAAAQAGAVTACTGKRNKKRQVPRLVDELYGRQGTYPGNLGCARRKKKVSARRWLGGIDTSKVPDYPGAWVSGTLGRVCVRKETTRGVRRIDGGNEFTRHVCI